MELVLGSEVIDLKGEEVRDNGKELSPEEDLRCRKPCKAEGSSLIKRDNRGRLDQKIALTQGVIRVRTSDVVPVPKRWKDIRKFKKKKNQFN